MTRRLVPAALLLLSACSRPQDDVIEPVPAHTAETADRLMAEAERAAGNAQARAGAVPQTNNNDVENGQ